MAEAPSHPALTDEAWAFLEAYFDSRPTLAEGLEGLDTPELARLFTSPARGLMQAGLRLAPSALWLTAGHFSGRGLAYRDLVPR